MNNNLSMNKVSTDSSNVLLPDGTSHCQNQYTKFRFGIAALILMLSTYPMLNSLALIKS